MNGWDPIEEKGVETKWSASSDQGTTTTTSGAEGRGVSRIVVAWRAIVDSVMPPLGYEDRTGFHYGEKPWTD